MSVWHRIMVWLGLRPAPQHEPVKEKPTKPVLPNMVDLVTKAGELAANAVLLKLSEHQQGDLYKSFTIKDVDVFMEFKLWVFEQPEGYHAVFVQATVNPAHRRRDSSYLMNADESMDETHTKYCHVRDESVFKDAFYAGIGEVVRKRPNYEVPLVGALVPELEALNISRCGFGTDVIILGWFIGVPEVTPTETPEYTPENHDALMNQQQIVQTSYRKWLVDKLATQVQTTASLVVKQLTKHLTNTSHLVTDNDGVIRSQLEYCADGCTFAFNLDGRTLTLLTKGYINDHRYERLMAYVWDIDQFCAAYQGWVRDYLERELVVATGGEMRWVVETLPLEPVVGDHHCRIGFVLREVDYS